jgi:hypothetical protein
MRVLALSLILVASICGAQAAQEESVALGRVSVSASVEMTFQIE